jgi:streptogramin lyase
MQKLYGGIMKAGRGIVTLILLFQALISMSRPVIATGAITEFPLLGRPWDITSGSDGNLWFTSGNIVGRITPVGVTTEFKLDRVIQNSITTGPDGNLWFTESGTDKVGTIIPSIATFLVPANLPNNSQPVGIAAGPDGNLWATEAGANKIAKMTTGGHVLSEFTLPVAGSSPQGIVAGPDGQLWFT